MDRDLLRAAIARRVTNPKHQAAFDALVSQIPADPSVPNIESEILQAAKEFSGNQLVQAILNKKVTPEVLKDYEDSLQATEVKDNEDRYEVYESPTMESLVPKSDGSDRIPLWPRALNSKLAGGCLPGDHVLVFARPEMGKTATALNFCRGFAKSGHSVLYCSNEDSIQRLLVRAKASFSGMEYKECLENPEEADEKSGAAGFGLVRFVEMYPGSVHQLEHLVKEYRPQVLLVDQLINLVTRKSDNYTLTLGTIARGIRNIAKQYGLVAVSYAQASDSASNKLVLDMSDLNWSNTDVQGAVDLMIGMGANQDFLAKDWRMLSLCKNKLSGSHEYFPVKIDRFKSRLSSVE